MSIGVFVSVPRPRRQRWWHLRPSLTLRDLAHVVNLAQDAEAQRLHAIADRCLSCGVQSQVKLDAAASVLPRRLVKNREWTHAHVDMPGARRLARMEEQEES